MDNEFLRISEAAALMEVSAKTLRNWDKDGTFKPTHRFGNQRRYSRLQIEEWLKTKTQRLSDDGKPLTVEEGISILWSRTGMLGGLDETMATQMALVFENQRRHNEWNPYLSPDFRRVTIPICRRVFPMLKVDGVNITSGLPQKAEEIRVMPGYTRFWRPSLRDRFVQQMSLLDLEAQRTAEVAEKLRDDIQKLIMELGGKEFRFYCFSTNDSDDLLVHYGSEAPSKLYITIGDCKMPLDH